MNSIDKLPAYLQQYCSTQDYDRYTSRDHAAWRYIMRQSRAFFKHHAVGIYLEGLKRTAIPFDRIPRISEMDLALQEFGWGAVPVCGFIPPAAFLEFQARGILPIATDMRTTDHIAYTPAPDIVHEAAGHAPIVADAEYRAYLQQYAGMANKCIMSKQDIQLYESIRILSDIKENPDTKPEAIIAAQANLEAAGRAVTFVTESTKVSRMAWWTVEYGLLGSLKKPKIYGAGLLSSVSESQDCLFSERVRKVPLSIKCVDTTYDITEPQPQLFVADDIRHLTQVLEEFDRTLAYRLGGMKGLDEAKRAETVNTVQLDSGLQISGILSEYEIDREDKVSFLKFSGPCQLAHCDQQLVGQGKERHRHGFSGPIGRWSKFEQIPAHHLTDSDLANIGIRVGHRTRLSFTSGFEVEGNIVRIVRENSRLLYVTWSDAHVTRGDQIYFKPEWGEFDMPVGDSVESVFGGPADKTRFGSYAVGQASTVPGRQSPYSEHEKSVFAEYKKLRDWRSGASIFDGNSLAKDIVKGMPDEWLLSVELLEMGRSGDKISADTSKMLSMHLSDLSRRCDLQTSDLILKGMSLAAVPD